MRALIVAEGKHERDGALLALVSRLATTELQCESDRVSRKDIHAHHGKGPGFKKKAIRWLREAEQQGYEAIIFLIDEDGHAERIQQIDEAQDSKLGVSRRALGVAIRSFDAWMLADEQALTTALGYPATRQPDPETIRDPKELCARLLQDSANDMTQTEMYRAVAEAAGTETLQERCPRGFAPFADRVRAF